MIPFSVTLEEINLIVESLGLRPFQTSANLIFKLQEQFRNFESQQQNDIISTGESNETQKNLPAKGNESTQSKKRRGPKKPKA